MKQYKCSMSKKKESLDKKNERGTTKIETYVGFDELLGYADAEYLFEDVVDVLSKYYTYEGEGDDIVFDEDQAKDDPEFTIKIEGGDERADFYSEDIFYVHLPNKEAAEELAKVLGGELSESKKLESCKDGKKESMERCDSCGAVMTEYDYDRYGGLCKRCRDKGEAKKSEGLSEYRHYTNPDNGRTASLDPIKHPGLNKFIVYFEAGEKRYSSIKDAEDDLKSRGYEKDESKKSEDASSVDDLLARHNQKWLVKVSYDVDASHSAVAPSIVRADTKDAATNIALKRHSGLGYNMKVVSVEPMTESRKKSEDFDMNKAFFQAKKAITDWTKRQGHKTLEWLYTDGRKSPTSYPSGIWDFEWDTGNGMATAELKVSPYETRTNSWNNSMDFGLRVGTEDKPMFYTSVEDVLSALDTLISKTEIKMESKKSEGISDMIDAKIDYNMFMRMCKTAAYLEEDEDYWDALWEYYSDLGSIGDALVFFDNLFQYTSWKTAEDLWTDYSNILGDKPEGKDYEEALDAYLDENDNEVGNSAVYKYGDHYLMLH